MMTREAQIAFAAINLDQAFALLFAATKQDDPLTSESYSVRGPYMNMLDWITTHANDEKVPEESLAEIHKFYGKIASEME